MESEMFTGAVQEYLQGLPPPADPILQEMEEAARKEQFPIVGPQVGRLLFQLVVLRKPAEIFELGSGFGYSAWWMASASREVRLTCTERRSDHIARARSWLERSGLLGRVQWHQADALETLAASGRTFDFIFNDVDKESYPRVLPLALRHLNAGGLLVTDNLLWRGRVANPAVRDPATEAIREYNRLLFNTPGLFSSILPIRDGVGVTLKL